MGGEFWLEDGIVLQNQNPVPAGGLRRLQGTAVGKHATPTTRPRVRPVATAKPRSLARSRNFAAQYGGHAMKLTCGDDPLCLRAQLLPALRPLVEIDDENCVNAIPEWRVNRSDGKRTQNLRRLVALAFPTGNERIQRLEGSLRFAREWGTGRSSSFHI